MAFDIRGVTPLLYVFDMPVSIQFYRDILGFEVVSSSEDGDDCDWALLRLNETELMLNTAYERDERPDEPDPGLIDAHADTCLYFGLEDLDGAYRELRDLGVVINEPVLKPYGMKQLTLVDPDGFQLCFQWPTDPA